MMYVDFTAGNKDYKLRLSTRSTVALEKNLKCNPLMVFGNGDRVPTITEMVQILHASLVQYNSGISLNDAYDIFDSYIADGHSITDFIPVIVEIYQISGIIPKGDNTEKN